MFFRFALLAALFALFIYWFSIRVVDEDRPNYEKLIAESIHLRTRRALEEEPAFQKRQNVQKDIWSQDETRHFRIQSRDSNLRIAQKGEKMEATEILENICCLTPNDCQLFADEGIYNYPSHQFMAQNNCRLHQGKNNINGSRIDLDLIEEMLILESPKGHIAQGDFDFEAKNLLWDKSANLLHLIDDVKITQTEDLTLLANRGKVHLDQLQPNLVVLDGNVRLISSRFEDKESFAMANQMTYNPADQTLLLSADKRVLFWQEGLNLSAKEVLIRQDQTIEGHGDVHFTFSLEEQNTIDEFFKQYL